MDASKYLNNNEILKLELQKYKETNHNGLMCGLKTFDKIIRMDKGYLAVVTARAGSGKTTFLNYYSYLMNQKHNWKTLFISFEMSLYKHISVLEDYYNKTDIVLDNNFFANYSALNTLKDVFNTIKANKEVNNIDMCIVDPFNYIPMDKDLNTNTIGEVLSKFKKLAIELNILIIIVAHPTKVSSEQRLTGENVLGSIHFRNMADFLLVLERNGDYTTSVTADKIRYNLDMGLMGGECTLKYNINTKKFEETTNKKANYLDEIFKQIEIKDEILNNVKSKIKINNSIKKEITHDNSDNNSNEHILCGDDSYNSTCNIQARKKIDENIFQKKISVYQLKEGKQDYKGYTTLSTALKMGKEHIQAIDEVRQCQDDVTKRELKKKLLMFTTSGLFTEGRTKDKITEYNNVICIDIDGKDNNLTLDEIKEKVNALPYVFYSSISCSGKGLYALVQVDGNVDSFVPHFKALEQDFSNMGIVIDPSCKDVTRTRFVSYDNDPYTNTEAIVYTKAKSDEIFQQVKTNKPIELKGNEKEKMEELIKNINENNINIVPNHADSLQVRAALVNTFKEDGLKYWLVIRSKKKGFDKSKSEYDYFNDSKKTNIGNYGMGTIIHKYKQATK